ncbi:MAG: hypothetical protein ACI391_03545 [Muribaculaceae bacterium]
MKNSKNIAILYTVTVLNIIWQILCLLLALYFKESDLVNFTIPISFLINILIIGRISFFKLGCWFYCLLVVLLFVLLPAFQRVNIWYWSALTFNMVLCLVTTILAKKLPSTTLPSPSILRYSPHVIIQLSAVALVVFCFSISRLRIGEAVLLSLFLILPILILILNIPIFRIIIGQAIAKVRRPLTIASLCFSAINFVLSFLFTYRFDYLLISFALLLFNIITVMRVKADIALDKRFYVKGRRLWRKFRR